MERGSGAASSSGATQAGSRSRFEKLGLTLVEEGGPLEFATTSEFPESDLRRLVPPEKVMSPKSPKKIVPPRGAITHELKPTDTLAGLALRYKCTVEDIMRVNSLRYEQDVYAMTQLVVPQETAKKDPDELDALQFLPKFRPRWAGATAPASHEPDQGGDRPPAPASLRAWRFRETQKYEDLLHSDDEDAPGSARGRPPVRRGNSRLDMELAALKAKVVEVKDKVTKKVKEAIKELGEVGKKAANRAARRSEEISIGAGGSVATSTAPAAQRRVVGGGDAWTREASDAIPLSDNASVATSDAPRDGGFQVIGGGAAPGFRSRGGGKKSD